MNEEIRACKALSISVMLRNCQENVETHAEGVKDGARDGALDATADLDLG
jgi:hypothetical protein